MKPIPLFADFYFETHESDGILIRERLFLAAFAEKKKKGGQNCASQHLTVRHEDRESYTL